MYGRIKNIGPFKANPHRPDLKIIFWRARPQGECGGRTGREEKGREELTSAMDMYRDMEMTFWLDKAEEALAEVG